VRQLRAHKPKASHHERPAHESHANQELSCVQNGRQELRGAKQVPAAAGVVILSEQGERRISPEILSSAQPSAMSSESPLTRLSESSRATCTASQSPVSRPAPGAPSPAVSAPPATSPAAEAPPEPPPPPAPLRGFTLWREGHSHDWYAPASWSGRPDPFPSRQEKQRRELLRKMNSRRWQHRMQNNNFWE
jgi:hypothetical protein